MIKRYEYTPDPLPKGDLRANEVFVFGANQLGEHGGGSARAAVDDMGAVWGEIHRTGRCYGIVTLLFPTKGSGFPQRVTKEELDAEFELFFKATMLEPEKTFYLTKVGLGIAGWTIEEVKDSFWKHYCRARHKNVIFPIEFEIPNSVEEND